MYVGGSTAHAIGRSGSWPLVTIVIFLSFFFFFFI